MKKTFSSNVYMYMRLLVEIALMTHFQLLRAALKVAPLLLHRGGNAERSQDFIKHPYEQHSGLRE